MRKVQNSDYLNSDNPIHNDIYRILRLNYKTNYNTTQGTVHFVLLAIITAEENNEEDSFVAVIN